LHAIAEKDLPGEAQQALVKFYHCCANINKKDNSTLHRYRLSDHRLKNVSGAISGHATYVCVPGLSRHAFLLQNAKYVFPACLLFLPFLCHDRGPGGTTQAYDIA
jgi:hypothetical protein